MLSNFTTLCYIEEGSRYLLMHRVKKEADVNKDKWIGLGGHFEEGESPEDCLLREVYEECGIRLTSYRFRGLITFLSDVWPAEYMCLYTADAYTGTIGECSEGTLCWVEKADVPSLSIWQGDRIFLRLLQEDASFFSLKLRYEGEKLAEAVLDGKEMPL